MRQLSFAPGPEIQFRCGIDEAEGCRALLACVMQQAINDLGDPDRWEGAREWFLFPDDSSVTSLTSVCDVLGWDARSIINALWPALKAPPERFVGAITTRRHWGR